MTDSNSQILIFNAFKKPGYDEKKGIINFLYKHLGEYGDPKAEIERAIDYSIKEYSSFGGFTLVNKIEGEIVGAVVMNRTGMKKYIPENILVYIATHEEYRGNGIGKMLLDKALELAGGDVALHVEPDNPAKKLYEMKGFTNKYLEMRFIRTNN